MTAVLLIFAVLLLVLLNGFFVAAEFGLVRARREKLEAVVAEGGRGAPRRADGAAPARQHRRVPVGLPARHHADLDRHRLPGRGRAGAPARGRARRRRVATRSPRRSRSCSPTCWRPARTSRIGEQVPKIYAITHPEAISRRCARPLHWFRIALKPAIIALNAASNAMLRLLGVRSDSAEFEEATRAEDLKMLIAQGVTGGTLDPGEAGMLHGVFHLHEQEARQVMTPIPAVVTVDVSETVSDRPPALHRVRPHAAGRDRGREHRPRQGHRPQQLAGAADDARGPRRARSSPRSRTR